MCLYLQQFFWPFVNKFFWGLFDKPFICFCFCLFFLAFSKSYSITKYNNGLQWLSKAFSAISKGWRLHLSVSLSTCGGYKTLLISSCEYILNHLLMWIHFKWSDNAADWFSIFFSTEPVSDEHIGWFQIGQYSRLAESNILNLILYSGVCIWYLRVCIWNFGGGYLVFGWPALHWLIPDWSAALAESSRSGVWSSAQSYPSHCLPRGETKSDE